MDFAQVCSKLKTDLTTLPIKHIYIETFRTREDVLSMDLREIFDPYIHQRYFVKVFEETNYFCMKPKYRIQIVIPSITFISG